MLVSAVACPGVQGTSHHSPPAGNSCSFLVEPPAERADISSNQRRRLCLRRASNLKINRICLRAPCICRRRSSSRGNPMKPPRREIFASGSRRCRASRHCLESRERKTIRPDRCASSVDHPAGLATDVTRGLSASRWPSGSASRSSSRTGLEPLAISAANMVVCVSGRLHAAGGDIGQCDQCYPLSRPQLQFRPRYRVRSLHGHYDYRLA